MRIRVRNTCVALLLSFVSVRAQAQSPAQPPPDHETSAELSFVGTGGNSSTETIGVGGSRFDRVDGWLITSKAAYVRNNSDGVLKAESIALAFQGAKILTPKLSVFGKYGFLHDRFAGIESRNTIAIGEAYILIDNKKNKFTVDGAFGYASEERTISATTKTATWDMGLLYDLKLSDNAEITDEAGGVFAVGRQRLAIRKRRDGQRQADDGLLAQVFQYGSLRQRPGARLSEDRHGHRDRARRKILRNDALRRPRLARLLSHRRRPGGVRTSRLRLSRAVARRRRQPAPAGAA
jgi:putative salt-induced outer membrane protein YdiY